MSSSFWGLEIVPGKTYQQVVEEDFRVSMVALGATLKNDTRGTLMVRVDGDEHVICSLIPGKIEQQIVDLVFSAGEEIEFQVTGVNTFHLTGNYMPDEENMMMGQGDSDEEEADEEEIDSDMELPSDEEAQEELMRLMMGAEGAEEDSEEESELELESGKIVELKEEPVPKLVELKKREAPAAEPEQAPPAKKTKAEKKKAAQAAKKAAAEQAAAAEKAEVVKEAVPEVAKAAAKPVAKAEKKQEAAEDDKKRVLPSGMIIEEIKKGDGARAKNGKKVLMRYIGKLMNGKEFDSNKSGKPFAFTLGRGEVIKGWDIGVQGMQVGGVRRLTIPAKLAYGAQGAPPDIPKNATLMFDIKMVDVK